MEGQGLSGGGGLNGRQPRVLAIDAGGTMTDTFIVDRHGDFVVGKAQTTPSDEAVGFMASTRDALAYWDLEAESALPSVMSGIYSGTAMLNRLLERKGRRVGLIVTAGMEDGLRLERGIQTYLGYPYSDRLHVATHHHNEPLVPRELVHGVRGRVDLFGDEAIPLYEDEARAAAEQLARAGVEGIVINLLYSYRNGSHEQRIVEIINEVAPDMPVFASSDLYPMRRDFPRLNSTLIEAYAAEPSREQLAKVRDATKEAGAQFDLRIMAAHGGTISIDAKELARTLISGPIGGVIGARYLADEIVSGNGSGPLSAKNIVCTDIGGTSFDIALITDGEFNIRQIPDIGRFLLNLPLVQVDSIGAGTGSFVRIEPNSGRPELGPDSAGAAIGVSWAEGGLETPSVTDLNLVLGRVNPDYFLGGYVKLDYERARAAISRQIAEPLGLDVEHAAAGIIELFDETLKYQAVAQVLGKGYSPVDYTLLCYGGGGPLHVAGYTADVPYRDVMVPAWAAGFSAFGCACGDFAYRYDLTIDMPIEPGADEDQRLGVGIYIDGGWQMLRERVVEEFAKSGVAEGDITFRHYARMQYYGQLNDIEIYSPHQSISETSHVDDLIAAFEDAYGKLYARSARSPELGYLVTNVIVTGSAEVEKPALPDETEAAGEPPSKGSRPVWWSDGWVETPLYEQDEIRAGHSVAGPAVIESPADTFAIPPGRRARLDRHRIFHLETEGELSMAVVDRTRELEPREDVPIGWDGHTALEMLSESERLFADTGRYCGMDELPLKAGEPIRFEKLFSRLRGGLVTARETALNISASPIVKEIGELCFALYTPEGDSVALSTGIIVHVHTMSDAIKYMIRQGYEENPGIAHGDIFTNNDAMIGDVHNADVQTIVPIFWEGELIGWAGGVTHEIDIGAKTPGSVPVGPISRFEDGIDLPAKKIGSNDELWRDHVLAGLKGTRTPMYWTLDEKTRLAGCHMIREAVERVILEEGIGTYKQFIREVIEDGRRAFKSRLREMTVPGRYRAPAFTELMFGKETQLPSYARKDTLMHAPVELRITRDGVMELDYDGASAWGYHSANCTPSSMQGALWVQLTQTLICNDKVNDGAYLGLRTNFPPGTLSNHSNPQASTGNAWFFLIPSYTGFIKSLSRSLQARGFVEEVLAPYALTANAFQGGGIDQYGRQSATTNFGLSCVGGGGKMVLDGLDYAAAMWNPEGDMGDMEMWELIEPFLYLSQRVKPNTSGPGRHRGGSGYECLRLAWKTPFYEMQNIGHGRVFIQSGLWGGYPGATGYRHNVRGADLLAKAQRGEPFPLAEPDPADSALLREIAGEHLFDIETTTLPEVYKEGDLYLCMFRGATGVGDPIERPYESVMADIEGDFLLPRYAESVYGVVAGDPDATDRRREAAREERGQKAVPVREWMKGERQRILDRDMIAPAQRMYAESMQLSERWAQEFKEFWDLPDDFAFDVPTPEVDLARAIQEQTAHDGQSPSIASGEGSA